MTKIVETCPGCETTIVHADDCPTLDPPEVPLRCLSLRPHPPHLYMLKRTPRPCPGVPEPCGAVFVLPFGDGETITCAREAGHPLTEDAFTWHSAKNGGTEVTWHDTAAMAGPSPEVPQPRNTCSYCGAETTYQPFSGGKEWYCPECEETGPYEEGQAPRRAAMLTTPEGRTALREEMRKHLAAQGPVASTPPGDLYFCPTVGEIESAGHSGFDTCCAHPELHVPVGPETPAIAAISQYLSEQAEARYYNIGGSSTVHTATAHKYLSTACYHADHDYCQNDKGSNGAVSWNKMPAECKFCSAKCICSCHRPGTVTVVERIVRPLEEVNPGLEYCYAPPPGQPGEIITTEDGAQYAWGDCDCTRPKGHDGDHACEPCAERYGAPSWPQTPDPRIGRPIDSEVMKGITERLRAEESSEEASDDQNAREHQEHTQQRTKGVVAVIGRGVIRLPGQRGLG